MSTVRNEDELGTIMQKIVSRLLADQDLMKLLVYTDKDPLGQPDLIDLEQYLHSHVLVVPRANPQDDSKSWIGIKLLKGVQNLNNTEFEDVYFNIEIFVPITQWIIKNENLRPYAIIGAIKRILKNKKINGLGEIKFVSWNFNFDTNEMSAHELLFRLVEYN